MSVQDTYNDKARAECLIIELNGRDTLHTLPSRGLETEREISSALFLDSLLFLSFILLSVIFRFYIWDVQTRFV